mgnify:CR=1 FL=1
MAHPGRIAALEEPQNGHQMIETPSSAAGDGQGGRSPFPGLTDGDFRIRLVLVPGIPQDPGGRKPVKKAPVGKAVEIADHESGIDARGEGRVEAGIRG